MLSCYSCRLYFRALSLCSISLNKLMIEATVGFFVVPRRRLLPLFPNLCCCSHDDEKGVESPRATFLSPPPTFPGIFSPKILRGRANDGSYFFGIAPFLTTRKMRRMRNEWWFLFHTSKWELLTWGFPSHDTSFVIHWEDLLYTIVSVLFSSPKLCYHHHYYYYSKLHANTQFCSLW